MTLVKSGRRTPGRQARLSREKIIEQALVLLQDLSTDDLTMARIAEGLGTTAMALYKYFPNRDALLDAVAEHAFSLFEPAMPVADNWQDQLLGWLRALQRHIDEYPTVMKVMGWDGRVSGAWVRVVAPVASLLSEQGLSGERLAFVLVWFMSSAMGLLRTETLDAPAYRQKYSFSALDHMSPDEQQAFLSLLPHLPATDRAEVMDFGLRQLVQSLERAMGEPEHGQGHKQGPGNGRALARVEPEAGSERQA